MLTDVPVRAYGLGTSMACSFGRKSWILSACPTGDQGNLEKEPHLISTIQLRNVHALALCGESSTSGVQMTCHYAHEAYPVLHA